MASLQLQGNLMKRKAILRISRMVAVLAAVAIVPAMAQAQARNEIDSYLGVWNYTQPDRATMTNIATLEVPVLPVQFPQIGTVTFAAEPGGVTGRSDQGCTWHFIAVPGGFDLRDRTQRCFNEVIQSAYTMDTWSIRFDGDHAAETVHATSHQRFGDVGFSLARGERVRAGIPGREEALANLTGSWTYNPPDAARLVNIVNPFSGPRPWSGTVEIAPGPGARIVATTPANGCTWTLAASGNTAVLEPGRQVCQSDKGPITVTFWTISTDGRRQSSIVSGIDPHGNQFLLSVGELAKR